MILLLLQYFFGNLFIIAIAIISFEIIAITKSSKLYLIQKKYLNFLRKLASIRRILQTLCITELELVIESKNLKFYNIF